MTCLRKSFSISSFYLRSSTVRRLSSSTSSSTPNHEILLSTNPPNSQKQQTTSTSTSTSNESPHSNHTQIPNLQNAKTPINQDSTILSESHVISVLLSLKHEPLSALKYFNWAQNQPGFYKGLQSFCVMYHIILSCSDFAEISAVGFVSSRISFVNAATVIQGLLKSSEKFNFGINSSTFEYLLIGYVAAGRLDNAIACFDVLIENFGVNLKSDFANRLLRMLIKYNRFEKAEELCYKMNSVGIFGNLKIFEKMMESLVEKGMFEEAKELVGKARELGFRLKGQSGSFAFEFVRPEHDSSAACDLLMYMIDKGLTPRHSCFVIVIKAAVLQSKMEVAMRVKDQMISCGFPMMANVAATLTKGYFDCGDLEGALSLFTSSIKCGICPSRAHFLVAISECCKRGNMVDALELHNLMIEMGFKSSFYVTFLFLKGFLDAQLWENACEFLTMQENSGFVEIYSFNLLMSWLCLEGKVDAARQLWDKIVETRSLPNLVFVNYPYSSKHRTVDLSNDIGIGYKRSGVIYTTLMDGYFKKGEVEKALKVFDEMVSQQVECKAYTYNTIICGLCRNGQTSQARKMLQNFIEGAWFKPSFITYSFIKEGFTKEGDTESASSLSTEMSENRLSQDVMLKNDWVDNICKVKTHEHVLRLTREMVKEGFELDITAFEKLIFSFCQEGSMAVAWKFYAELIRTGVPPSESILDSMIKGFQLIEERRMP